MVNRVGSLRRMEAKITGDEQLEESRSQSPNDKYSVHSFHKQLFINYYVPDTILKTGDSSVNFSRKIFALVDLHSSMIPILYGNLKKKICVCTCVSVHMYVCIYVCVYI